MSIAALVPCAAYSTRDTIPKYAAGLAKQNMKLLTVTNQFLPRKRQQLEQVVVGSAVGGLHRSEPRPKKAAAASIIDAKKALLYSPPTVKLILCGDSRVKVVVRSEEHTSE